jgi:hypothetical protein
LIGSLPPNQQQIIGAMAPAQQAQFISAPASVQESMAGFSLPPTPAPPTPAPPTKAPAASGGGITALIGSLPPNQQQIIGAMAPAQQAQFISAPASVQESMAGFSLPPTPAPPTPAPPTAALPTAAPRSPTMLEAKFLRRMRMVTG